MRSSNSLLALYLPCPVRSETSMTLFCAFLICSIALALTCSFSSQISFVSKFYTDVQLKVRTNDGEARRGHDLVHDANHFSNTEGVDVRSPEEQQ